MQFNRISFSNENLINIYKQLLLPRLIEERMLILLRQGKISKWFSGIGQEAIAVGSTYALQANEWIMPLHRNLGVFTTRKMPLHKLFLQWEGHYNGYSKGRERSFHFGSAEHYICGMISHLGPQLSVADGTALASVLQKDKKVTLAFSGEGGTSEGEFHEALNVAAVWNLPVIFLIENNGYALSTPIQEQFKCKSLADKGIGYGINSIQIDGNNILEVIETISRIKEECIREQKPFLVEAITFRMRGHEEASGTKYVPSHLFEEWGKKDPIKNYEDFLLKEHVIDENMALMFRKECNNYIEAELAIAFKASSSVLIPNTEEELKDVYAPPSTQIKTTVITNIHEHELPSREIRMIEAIKEGLYQSMQQHSNLILMGQDIAEYGGAFKVTDGFYKEFGKERVRNTPLCESAIVGAALGLSLEGFKSMVEMQFADFVTVAFNQIVNNLAKIHYRWNQAAQVVIRMPTGAGVNAGPFHSQSTEAWFAHVPGLKIVYPSTPFDAKGLLIAAFNNQNPVLFFEHKALYRSISGNVPQAYYEVPIGKAAQVMDGNDISIITYGYGVHWAMEYAQAHSEIGFHILDLRTLLPLDYEAIAYSVKKTGKVLILHEDTLTGGIGAEIAAWISEHCFEWLDAPVMRCASLDTPVPFNIELEKNFLAKSRLSQQIEKLRLY
jgi:2-oxoisovalerate dehydrogenase E1 component